ncbi:ABC transporter substrate-binding protein [Chloroflexus sp.]|uniref:ABC transporter substrate-binding protein n=1 Tax=Chloroflexus sp. TaxID=1904827 RepID=UPI002628CF3D|nr:ABC transporter substrate-binding protein [uncultured Chloroflexus sp.]
MARRHLFILLIVVLLTFTTACASTNPATNTPATTNAPEVTEVTMRLQWLPQFQFAGYLVAEARGYYRDAGLSVTILPGGPDAVPLPLVATGADTFGSTGADTVLISREQGIEVVALATWFQASPVAFMVHRDSGIRSPQDFVGRRVGMFYGDNVETEYRALLAATGVDPASVNEIPGDYSLAPFLERQADVWPVYATDQPYTARAAGADIELIVARDYGVELMGDVLFTTAEFARNNPNTVRAFVQATLRGWEEALTDPAAAIDIILARSPDFDRGHLEFEATETIKLLRYGIGAQCVGASDRQLWAKEAELLRSLGVLQTSIDPNTVLLTDAVDEYYRARGIECGR